LWVQAKRRARKEGRARDMQYIGSVYLKLLHRHDYFGQRQSRTGEQ
jgi:hypothetical protein